MQISYKHILIDDSSMDKSRMLLRFTENKFPIHNSSNNFDIWYKIKTLSIDQKHLALKDKSVLKNLTCSFL